MRVVCMCDWIVVIYHLSIVSGKMIRTISSISVKMMWVL